MKRAFYRLWPYGIACFIVGLLFICVLVAVRLETPAPHQAPPKKIYHLMASATPRPSNTPEKTHVTTPPSPSTKVASPSPSLSPTPATAACSLLTAQIAAQLIGASPTLDTASSITTDTADVETTICAYTNGTGAATQRVQLTVHKARTSLGVSENDVAFGSGRPEGAQSVQGFGQSAYWDVATSELNILASNVWYACSRSHGEPLVTGDSQDTQAMAVLLPGLHQ
jgi:hypothetical protein